MLDLEDKVILITVAGLDLLATDLAVWDRTMAVNLRGTLLMTRAVLPAMIDRGGGAVVTMASRQGSAPPQSGRRVAYGTSTAATAACCRIYTNDVQVKGAW